LDQINKLFAIERELKQVSPEKRLKARELRSRPVVEGFRKWLDDIKPMIVPQSLLGKAVTYGHNQWGKLLRFLEDGRIEIRNNLERSIKAFVIGRKNWLFYNTPKGARTSAIIYSMVETLRKMG
jgi:hypothetical protein